MSRAPSDGAAATDIARRGIARHDIARHGADLAERLLGEIYPGTGGFGRPWLCPADIAAHQLLWQRHMATGAPRFADAVLGSLRAICGSALVDDKCGGIYRLGTREAPRVPRLEKDLCDNARFLELLTWVWRVERCPTLRRCAEGIATWAVGELHASGSKIATGTDTDTDTGTDTGTRDARVTAVGLMSVALIEAGSVFERRDWLALARVVFDEGAADLEKTCGPSGDKAGTPGAVDGDRADRGVTMSRAAIRLFEAFGKQRDLARAEAWVATLGATPRDVAEQHADRSIATGDALMIGVFARLHALTETSHYAERANDLVQASHPAITRSAIAAATAIANVETAAQLVSIRVSGDPRLADTRELMRIALDCGLPDRLVLGPGAGGAAGERPVAQISIGGRRLAPVGDAARLRLMLAPGGLAAFLRLDAGETVDSRRMGGIP